MGRETSPQVPAALAAVMKSRAGVVLGQWVLLLGAAAVASMLATEWAEVWTTYLSPFWSHPLAILLGCLFVFHCIRGAKLTSYKRAYFGYRAVLLILSCAAAITALREPLFLGSLVLGSLLAGSDDSEGPGYGFFLFFFGEGTALIALAAAGIRFVFDWQVRYWLFFLEFGAGLMVLLLILFFPVILAFVQAMLKSDAHPKAKLFSATRECRDGAGLITEAI